MNANELSTNMLRIKYRGDSTQLLTDRIEAVRETIADYLPTQTERRDRWARKVAIMRLVLRQRQGRA